MITNFHTKIRPTVSLLIYLLHLRGKFIPHPVHEMKIFFIIPYFRVIAK